MQPLVDWPQYQAVLFDLDGVLTDTASVHSAVWKEAFDGFLQRRFGAGFQPFSIDSDYLRFVDGKPRFEGVAAFLDSRGIHLPWGSPADPPGDTTICAIGNLKNVLVGAILASDGVALYPGSKALIDALAGTHIKMAVVTSSANADGVLTAAGISEFFPVVVDGVVAAQLGLGGKPHPDPFLEAGRRLGVLPSEAVVVEDAVSGVAAGRAGGFGLVIGVARHDNTAALEEAGADLVVGDLAELV